MEEDNKKYFIVVSDNADDIVPDAEHIVRNDEFCAELGVINEYDDFDAAAEAERDGIALIHGLDGIYDGFYLDTPENLAIISKYLAQNKFVINQSGHMEYAMKG